MGAATSFVSSVEATDSAHIATAGAAFLISGAAERKETLAVAGRRPRLPRAPVENASAHPAAARIAQTAKLRPPIVRTYLSLLGCVCFCQATCLLTENPPGLLGGPSPSVCSAARQGGVQRGSAIIRGQQWVRTSRGTRLRGTVRRYMLAAAQRMACSCFQVHNRALLRVLDARQCAAAPLPWDLEVHY